MHTRKTETDDPFFHRAVSSHGATSERISIELQRLATQADETLSAAIGAKSVNADDCRSSADAEPSPGPARKVSRLHSVVEIATLAGISFLNTMGSGILIAALPRIAQDLDLPQGLILWPAAVYALAAGCLLLIFGATADAIGTKLVWVTGGFLYTGFTLAIGFAQTGIQLILFRAFQGSPYLCAYQRLSVLSRTLFLKASGATRHLP
jgi:hypothetical protein